MSFSVLLSVYSKEKPEYLNQAFFSIWDQQALKPDQIVLVKDGPLTPELDSEIVRWHDKLGKVLTLVDLPENVGLGAALNVGLESCEHELVARMDTDDVAMQQRFQAQVDFMTSHPDIAASSAVVEEWSEDLSRRTGSRVLPLESGRLAEFARKRSPLSHPATIFRKSAVENVGGYPPLRKSQDYGLWALLLVNGYKLANVPDTVLKMRAGDDLFVRRGAEFLSHELALLRFQRRIGFLRADQYLYNCVLKACLRLSPAFLKKFAYRHLR